MVEHGFFCLIRSPFIPYEIHISIVCFFSIADYDAFSERNLNSQRRAPSPSTVDFDQMRVSQWDGRTSSTRSSDETRSARRCLLRVVPGKGLGFVLSATGDYDHTITAVDKVYLVKRGGEITASIFASSFQWRTLLVYK